MARWRSGRIRKLVRRARGSAWTKVQAVDGITVELPRSDGATPVEARAFVPGPIDRVPRPVGRLQIQSGPLDDPTRVGEVDQRSNGLLVAVTPEVEMSWGKQAAQCAHATKRAWETASSERRAAWDRAGRPLAVVHPDPVLLARLVAGPRSTSTTAATPRSRPEP